MRNSKSFDDECIYNLRLEKKLRKSSKCFKFIDLFSGAGGLTLGFTKSFDHQFEPIWANDNDESAVNTYIANFGAHCVHGDILEILKKSQSVIPKADIVIGGPPCQGFSLLNKRRKGDARRTLWRPFLEIVKLSKAKIFLMENVPQLLGSREHEQIIQFAEELGFIVLSAKLFGVDYGVPQKRKRAFILGSRIGNPHKVFPPRKTHFNINKDKHISRFEQNGSYVANAHIWSTVRDAIQDLPPPSGNEIGQCKPPLDLHFGRNPTTMSRKRYRAIPMEGMNRFDLQRNAPELTPRCWIKKKSGGTDLFGRLWWDRPALTIRTEFFKPEKGRYLHPCQHRPITHREAARLQSFPDSFRFLGSKIEIAKQIGNAVPPLLAARVADSILALLLNHKKHR